MKIVNTIKEFIEKFNRNENGNENEKGEIVEPTIQKWKALDMWYEEEIIARGSKLPGARPLSDKEANIFGFKNGEDGKLYYIRKTKNDKVTEKLKEIYQIEKRIVNPKNDNQAILILSIFDGEFNNGYQ